MNFPTWRASSPPRARCSCRMNTIWLLTPVLSFQYSVPDLLNLFCNNVLALRCFINFHDTAQLLLNHGIKKQVSVYHLILLFSLDGFVPSGRKILRNGNVICDVRRPIGKFYMMFSFLLPTALANVWIQCIRIAGTNPAYKSKTDWNKRLLQGLSRLLSEPTKRTNRIVRCIRGK